MGAPKEGGQAGRQQAEGNKKKVEVEEKERACHATMCIYPPDTD